MKKRYKKNMESIPHFIESILKKYGVHPQVHGIHPPFHGNENLIEINAIPILFYEISLTLFLFFI